MIGKTLGPYQIQEKIGAGGMGEVYRARDTRLARDVAVKILPASLLGDPDRLQRFQQEAQATGQLNHPNILVVFDTGEEDGTPFMVSELLQGKTLREEMADRPLPVRKVIDYGRQIAEGLAAAHRKGIVHRDLKPENVFITDEGRVKILDFGLAKLTTESLLGGTQIDEAPTRAQTNPGAVLGTVGYMSPEQVRGGAVDERSDLFNLGTILYEMLTGKAPFREDSSIETLNAILKHEPPEPSRENPDVSPGLDRVVQRCLEKNPEQRCQSASDLAFQIGTLTGSTTSLSTSVAAVSEKPRLGNAGRLAVLAAVAVAAAMGAFFLGQSTRPTPSMVPSYRQLTFRQGAIGSARFTPDGETVVYSAAWDGQVRQLYTTQVASQGSRPLDQQRAEVVGVSDQSDLLLLLDPTYVVGFTRQGTLARLPLVGGLPRPIVENAQTADWAPDGTNVAVAILERDTSRLEYPLGNEIYRCEGWMSWLRVARAGDRIAFFEHPALGDNRGRVVVIDLEGTVVAASEWLGSLVGLAWSVDDADVLFTGAWAGINRAVYSMDLTSRVQLVNSAPADLTVVDVNADGKMLLLRNTMRRGIQGRAPGETEERDLSYLDWSRPGDLSSDGRWLLFEEQGQGGGTSYKAYLRGTDGSPPLELGTGTTCSLSADGQWALTVSLAERNVINIVPLGTGEPRRLEIVDLLVGWAAWLPDSRRLLVLGKREGEESRLFIVDTEGNVGDPVTPEGLTFRYTISPDGQWIAATTDEGVRFFPTEGGEGRSVEGVLPEDLPLRFSADGKSLFVTQPGDLSVRIFRVDLETGERRTWKEIQPRDRAGIQSVDFPLLSADGQSYVYSYREVLSALYLVDDSP